MARKLSPKAQDRKTAAKAQKEIKKILSELKKGTLDRKKLEHHLHEVSKNLNLMNFVHGPGD